MWQDYVISIGNIIFVISLIPSVLSKNKPALMTSLLSAVTLFLFVFTFLTLKLWFSAIAQAGSATLWSILAIQVFLEKKK